MNAATLDRPAQPPRTDAALPPPPRVAARAPRSAASPANASALRLALTIGAVGAAAVAWACASGFTSTVVEPDLARLLRGMAAIKGLLALSALTLVGWRVGRPISRPVAAAYVACTWALVAATVLIWQLAFLPAAALLFHAAGLGGLVLAMREGGAVPRGRARGAARMTTPAHAGGKDGVSA